MSNNPLLPISALFAFPNTFANKDEAIQLHKEVQAIDAQLKFRRELDISYAKLKLKKLNEERDEMDFQMGFADKRNDKLLDGLQKDIFKNISIINVTDQSRKKLEQFKGKYRDYLDYHRSHIQREFNYQILMKQNALIAEKAILTNQVMQNEKMIKMENEYCEKTHDTNKVLLEEIHVLKEKNARLNEERTKKALAHEAEQKKLALEKLDKEEISLVKDDETSLKQSYANSMIQTTINKEEPQVPNKEKKIKVTVEKVVELNLNHKYGKLDQIRQSRLDESIRKQKEDEFAKSQINNSSIVSFDGNKYKESKFNQSKVPPYQNNPIPKKDNVEEKQSATQRDTNTRGNEQPSIKPNQDSPKIKPLKQSSQFSFNQSNESLRIKPLQSSTDSNKVKPKETKVIDPLESIKLSHSIAMQENPSNNQSNVFDPYQSIHQSFGANNQPKESTIKQSVALNKPEDKKESIIEKQDSNEFEHFEVYENQSVKKEDNIANSQIKDPNQNELLTSSIGKDEDLHAKMMSTKPKLKDRLVFPEYKLLILKQLIPKIEKYSKSQKAGKHVYLIKHTNTKDNENQLKNQFYNLLELIHDKNETDQAFASLDINTSLQLVFEILSSNSNPNLKEANLANNKKNYDEEVFMNDIDEQYKQIIKIILEHMKLMVSTKKISLQLACTFMAKGLLNFPHTQTMESKLLLVLEKNLTQKYVNTPTPFANTFTSGFNDPAKTFYQSASKLQTNNPLSNSSKLNKKSTDDVFDEYQ